MPRRALRPDVSRTGRVRLAALTCAVALLAPRAAAAHPAALHAAEPATWWTVEPGVLAALALTAAWYALGVRGLWRAAGRGRGVGRARVAAFAGALVALVAALVSPLDAMAEQLFSAHMVQHLLLILVVAPLAVLGAPSFVWLWALPRAGRVALGRWWRRRRRLRRAAHGVTAPVSAWLLHSAALWIWHAPSAYQAALRRPAVHALEHLAFLGTALLFWWAVAPSAGRRRLSHGSGVLYVAAMGAQGSALGALLALSSVPWYPAHAPGAQAWHVAPIDDQQLAGLLMWIPASIVYVGTALALVARWLRAGEAVRVPPTPALPGRRRATAAPAVGSALVALALAVLGLGACRSDDARAAQAAAGGRTGAGMPAALAALEAGASQPVDPDSGRGAIVRYGCGSCHLIPGVSGADGMVGPPLIAWSRRTVIAGEVPNTPEQLVHWIVMPQSIEPGTAMPNLGVTDEEARNIAAYLYTLR